MKFVCSSLRLQSIPSRPGSAVKSLISRRHVPPASLVVRCRATQAASKEAQTALDALKEAIKGTARGMSTEPAQKSRILEAVATLEEIGRGTVTTSGQDIDGTWKLLWTTEKESLFILKNAKITGTEASDVYQVIDTGANELQNVITFKNGASFVVDSDLQEGGEQRLVFKFTAARLNLPNKTWKIPPFGKGWFDTVYLDEEYRVAKDIRGDTLVVQKDGPPRRF